MAIAAVNKGYRACILVATNLLMDQLQRYHLPKFKMDVTPYFAKGIEHYDCALTNDAANYGICTPQQREECSDNGRECSVLFTNAQLENHNFIITNFHKFLSVHRENGFDYIFIDDSHGFENALDDKFQTRVSYYSIDEIFKRHEQKGDIISDFTGEFLDFFDDVFRTVPSEQYQKKAKSWFWSH
jgi:hypothetical protein